MPSGTATAAAPATSSNATGQRLIFLFTYAAYIAVYFTRKPFSVAKSTLMAENVHTESELGLIDTAFLVSYAVGQFASGPVASFLGSKLGLALAFLGTGVCSWVFGSSPSKDMRSVAWLANGLFQAFFFPFIMDVLRAWFPPSSRGQVLGLWTTCQQLGGFATSAFGAYILGTSTWHNVFVLPAFVSFLFAFLCLFVLQTSLSSPVAPSLANNLPTSSQPWSVPHLTNVGSAYFCVKLVRYTFLGWLPFYLTAMLGYSAAESVLLSTAFDLAGTVGSVVCGYASDAWCGGYSARIVAPMCVLCGVATVLYPHVAASGQIANIAIMAAVGLFVAGPDSMLGGAACAEICERAHAPSASTGATGIVNGMGSLGAIASGMLPILVKGSYGWNVLFYTMGGLSVMGGLLLLPLARDTTHKKVD
ncbi:hypothetical protein DYB36_003042 [Aphanomyces astaci]|uniref:Major facilitator superfamily (MFS) profile domain-containing protein n=1 Tax=Aphanomyces astaci TaxID=112090 RepID=A0A397AGD2_APHAT|nr:hypothetical protein DYB36_003042 [Aphanomyces astaci]RHZ04851.1 hypothetical protein DYB31_002246 [Aphanomyces astaci]